MMEVKDNFIAETNGQCFFCSKIVSHRFPPVKLEAGLNPSPISSPPRHYSLQQLSRCERETIPPHLLAKVTRSTLKVELCEECVSLNEIFAKLFGKLEKIEMEVLSCVNMIQSRLSKGEKLDTTDERVCNNYLTQGKQQIVEGLKVEVMQKCQQKTKTAHPLIKIQNLSMKQVEAERLRMRLSHMRKYGYRIKQCEFEDATDDNSSHPELEAVQLKMEGSEEADPVGEDDTAETYFDDDDDDSESDKEKIRNKPQTSITGTSTMTNVKTHRNRELGKYSIISATNKLEAGSSTFNSKTQKYRCNTCLNEYTSHQSFKYHFNIAHLHAKFKCNICSKIFNQLSSFKYHDKTVHRCVKLKCSFCEKTFAQKSNLNEHIQGVHFKRKLKCQFCPKVFKYLTNKRGHILKMHK